LKIQDGGGRHLEKSKNRDISAAVRAISTKFGTVMQFNPLKPILTNFGMLVQFDPFDRFDR